MDSRFQNYLATIAETSTKAGTCFLCGPRHAAMRSALTYTVQLPLVWDGDTVYAYLLMSAPKAIGKACSDTLYIGTTPII